MLSAVPHKELKSDTSSLVKQLPAADTFSVVIAPVMICSSEAVEELECARVIEHTALCASTWDAYVHCAWEQ